MINTDKDAPHIFCQPYPFTVEGVTNPVLLAGMAIKVFSGIDKCVDEESFNKMADLCPVRVEGLVGETVVELLQYACEISNTIILVENGVFYCRGTADGGIETWGKKLEHQRPLT